MKVKTLVALLFGSILLCGCSAVILQHPLTSQPEVPDKEKFEGVWVVDEGTLQLHFSKDGTGQLAALEWKDGEYKINKGEVHIAKAEPFNIICARFMEDGEWQKGYMFGSYKFSDSGDLIIWPSDYKYFALAIKEDKLKGKIDKEEYSESVFISSDPADVMKFINESQKHNVFIYTEPTVLKKLDSGK
jgi:hypothetical protein